MHDRFRLIPPAVFAGILAFMAVGHLVATAQTGQPAAAEEPQQALCGMCHGEYNSWHATAHGMPRDPAAGPAPRVGCAVCHTAEVWSHASDADPIEHLPPDITRQSAEEKNALCGGCHAVAAVTGDKAIDVEAHPKAMSARFEGLSEPLDCTMCHSPHSRNPSMLRD